MLDVAVHPDGAAMDDAPNAGGGGGVDQVADGRGVDRAIGGLGNAGLTVDRGDVVDDVDILHRARERGTIFERADRRLDIRGFQFARLRRLPRETRERGSRGEPALVPDGRR